METTEEILNKLLERVEWYKRQVTACEEQRSFWAKRGRFPLADAWKRNAEENRKILEEIAKRLEEVNKEKEDKKDEILRKKYHR